MEFKARKTMSDWRFWMVLAYLGLVMLATGGFVINARTQRDEARTQRREAIRIAEQRAARDAAVARCLTSRPQLQRISRHVGGVNDGFQTLVDNSRAVLEATPRSDPQYKVRVANLRRLERALKNIAAVSSFPVPTVADCRAAGAVIRQG